MGKIVNKKISIDACAVPAEFPVSIRAQGGPRYPYPVGGSSDIPYTRTDQINAPL